MSKKRTDNPMIRIEVSEILTEVRSSKYIIILLNYFCSKSHYWYPKIFSEVIVITHNSLE